MKNTINTKFRNLRENCKLCKNMRKYDLINSEKIKPLNKNKNKNTNNLIIKNKLSLCKIKLIVKINLKCKINMAFNKIMKLQITFIEFKNKK